MGDIRAGRDSGLTRPFERVERVTSVELAFSAREPDAWQHVQPARPEGPLLTRWYVSDMVADRVRLSSFHRRSVVVTLTVMQYAGVGAFVGATLYYVMTNAVVGALGIVVFAVALVVGVVNGLRPDAWTEDGDIVVRTRRQTVRFRPGDVEAWGVVVKGQLPLVVVRMHDATEVDMWGAEPRPTIEILERAGVPRERLQGGYWSRLVRRLPRSA